MSDSWIKGYDGRTREIELFPKVRPPYYIWSYPWTHESSGARALHLLCHALNEAGEKAYLVPVNQIFYTNRLLNTPILDDATNWFYDHNYAEPIVIYPDIVQGNPLKARKVVRWLLAPAGAYGGDKEFAETDKIYGYTKNIAEPVLCLPTFDINIFCPPPFVSPRSGDCYYAHKYDRIHGNQLLPLTEDMTRCIGPIEDVAKILKSHDRCFVYERSEIAVLAALCGCEVIPVVTPYFDGKWPEEFFNADGTLVPQAVLHRNFCRQLEQFIKDTQGGWK